HVRTRRVAEEHQHGPAAHVLQAEPLVVLVRQREIAAEPRPWLVARGGRLPCLRASRERERRTHRADERHARPGCHGWPPAPCGWRCSDAIHADMSPASSSVMSRNAGMAPTPFRMETAMSAAADPCLYVRTSVRSDGGTSRRFADGPSPRPSTPWQ